MPELCGIPTVIPAKPTWPFDSRHAFDHLDHWEHAARREAYGSLKRKWEKWHDKVRYHYKFRTPAREVTNEDMAPVWKQWYLFRDLFLTLEGPNSDHPDIPCILEEHKSRLQTEQRKDEEREWAWNIEVARLAKLRKADTQCVPPKPTATELMLRRDQSKQAKRSNGVDYSKSKRQRQRDAIAKVEEEYSLSEGEDFWHVIPAVKQFDDDLQRKPAEYA